MHASTNGHVRHASQADFSALLQDDKPVLVDFWATWCPPCRMIAPTIESLAQETAGWATIAKVDVDQNPALAAQFAVRSIPTLVIFKSGREVDRLVGAHRQEALLARLVHAAKL